MSNSNVSTLVSLKLAAVIIERGALGTLSFRDLALKLIL